MTSYADSKLWQDVYHAPSPVGLLYVKFVADTVTEFRLLRSRRMTMDERICPETGAVMIRGRGQ